MADMTVASTTDTQSEINRAAGVIDKPVVEKPETEQDSDRSENTPDISPTVEDKAKPEEHKSKSGFQKRIDKLTRERHNDRAELDALRQRLAAIESGTKPAAQAATEPPPAVDADPKPDKAKYEDFDKYIEDLGRWSARQERRELETKIAQQTAEEKAQNERKAEYDAHLARLDEARERYDDFDEVADRVQRSGQFQLPAATQVAIVGAENSGDVVYYLMKHPEVCKKILTMSDARAIMEIGRISAALEPREGEFEEEEALVGAGAPKAKRASTAPAPIRPVGGSSTRSSVPLDELSYQDYRRIRDQQDKSRYRR